MRGRWGWGRGQRSMLVGFGGQCLTFCRYLKLKPRPAVIANCLALQQHFAVIYRCPLCQWVGGVVGENAARKIPWKFGRGPQSVCVCVNCHLLLSTFGANICTRLLLDCRLLVITFCQLISLFTMANLLYCWGKMHFPLSPQCGSHIDAYQILRIFRLKCNWPQHFGF